MLRQELARYPTHDVVSRGVRLRVRSAGTGDRLALLLHGFPERWFSWRHQIPMLAELGYRVWAPDLRGYGDSDRPTSIASYAMPELVGDVAALVQASGAREVVLIAHDWGANIAWHAVAQRACQIDRFVPMNMPHPTLMRRALLRPGRQMLRSSYVYLFQIPGLADRRLAADGAQAVRAAFMSMTTQPARYPRELLDLYAESALEPGAIPAMLAYYRATFRDRGALRSQLPMIEIPTLLLWGEEDTALGKELTYATSDHVRDLTTRYVTNASHWVQQDQPQIVNAMLRAWLEGDEVPQSWEVPVAAE